jgi:enoyl-CoA hydratase
MAATRLVKSSSSRTSDTASRATSVPLTLAAALMAIHCGMDASIDDGLAIEEAAFARIVPTWDAREGIATFLEKRSPSYRGQ